MVVSSSFRCFYGVNETLWFIALKSQCICHSVAGGLVCRCIRSGIFQGYTYTGRNVIQGEDGESQHNKIMCKQELLTYKIFRETNQDVGDCNF